MVASGKTVANRRRLWEKARSIRVLKGREESWRTFRTPELNVSATSRLTSGYHLAAALRQIRVFKQLLKNIYPTVSAFPQLLRF